MNLVGTDMDGSNIICTCVIQPYFIFPAMLNVETNADHAPDVRVRTPHVHQKNVNPLSWLHIHI